MEFFEKIVASASRIISANLRRFQLKNDLERPNKKKARYGHAAAQICRSKGTRNQDFWTPMLSRIGVQKS
jgi:hypothetical protein